MLALIPFIFFVAQVAQTDAKYYVTYYSYDTNPHRVRYTHTFAHFVKQTTTSTEEQTISWMPATLRITVLRRTPEQGVNLTLDQTLQLARSIGAQVISHGPFEITPELYNRAAMQVKQLQSGQVAYKCLDRRFRGFASNCIHAVSDLGGFLDTGTQSGEAATVAVVRLLEAFVVRQPQDLQRLAKTLCCLSRVVRGALALTQGPITDRQPGAAATSEPGQTARLPRRRS